MKKKKTMLLVVLLMAVGFAAVSTTLYINGQTNISANDDDFNVYYSNALVNGVQDKSVITDDTHITFTTTLETLGEKYVLDYDVTNGSKNYDAELVMECSEGNDYLTVTNDFDITTDLPSLQTRSGKLTLELIKSYAGEEDLEVTIDCTIDANAIERDSLGEVNSSAKLYEIGEEIILAGENFNVISQTDDNVTLFAQQVLNYEYKQSSSNNGVVFSNSSGWEYTPGPKEIDIQLYDGNAKNYVNSYVSYLEGELGVDIMGDLITVSELGTLGCVINADYATSGALSCSDSIYSSWLVNNQSWWTRSASSSHYVDVWYVDSNGEFHVDSYNNYYGLDGTGIKVGIRPVITISKSDLESL